MTVAVVLAALLDGSAAMPGAGPAAVSHCRAGETIAFTCRLGRKHGSVCAAPGRITYRFGSRGRPEIAVASTPDWSNIHVGGNRSQAGLDQDHIRFTTGNAHYVVHSGTTGSLNERPGRRFAGVVVLLGDDAREVASLSCDISTLVVSSRFSDPSAIAPAGWRGGETGGGPFDAIY